MFKVLADMLRKDAQSATAEFRNHLLQVRSKAQPLKVELVSSPDTSWLDSTASRPMVDFLLQSGFQRAGVVVVRGNDKAIVAGFASPENRVMASISKGGDLVYLSFVSHFNDGSAFECTNMPVPFEPPYPEWFVHRRYTGASAQNLWSAFLSERPSKPMQPASPNLFAESSEDDFSRYQAWMAERGGATREELETRYKAIRKLPAGKEADNFLKMARHDEAERALCNWWRLQADAPYPLDQIIDTLIIIHDDLPSDLLINAYWYGSNDFKVKDADFSGGSPRDTFARVAANRGSAINRIFQKRTPLQADFYVPK